MKRKRGAQLGNSNALKHGFYSLALSPFGKKALYQLCAANVDSEIETLRVLFRRCLQVSSPSVELDDVTRREILFTASYAIARLAALGRVQSHGRAILAERERLDQELNDLPADERKHDKDDNKETENNPPGS